MKWDVQQGDCRTLMAAMDEASVDSIVTDPPYELGFMGRSWDSTGITYNPDMWRQALRALKPGGHLVAFGGSRTYHRMVCAIEDAGFEIRDQIMWIYGIGTCLKPAHEPIVLARKPPVGSARANIAAHGTGGLNIDACRIEGEPPSKPQPRFGVTDGVTGFGAGQGRNGAMSSATARWPANVVHDGSDEVLAGLRNGGANDGSPARRGMFGSRTSGQGGTAFAGDSGSAARFFYCAKATKADRDEGLDDLPKRPAGLVSNTSGQHLTRRDEGYEVAPRANHHPTVKPEAVMRWLVRLVTPAGGIVLDPFAGSGSTGKAAILEGRSFIGCELTAEYVPIARARLAAACNRRTAQSRQSSLFAAVTA